MLKRSFIKVVVFITESHNSNEQTAHQTKPNLAIDILYSYHQLMRNIWFSGSHNLHQFTWACSIQTVLKSKWGLGMRPNVTRQIIKVLWCCKIKKPSQKYLIDCMNYLRA